jgi:hypothetical protein
MDYGTHSTTNVMLAVFERYVCINKLICIIALGLPRPDLLVLCTLEAEEVITESVYRVTYATYWYR